MDTIIGAYHELPSGKIAYTYGFSKGVISYRFEDYTYSSCDQFEYNTWIYRPDLNDFPDSKDPVLPYVFDLFWDLKRISDLKRYIENHGISPDIQDEIDNFNIVL